MAGTVEMRDRLHSLAALVDRGAGDALRGEFIEAAIAACLDEAVTALPTDRWLACEAATWALAWMARARRAGGSAGSLLERLVGEARSAVGMLAEGDTLPARFVLALSRLFRDIEACGLLEPSAREAVATEIERLVSPLGVLNVAGGAAVVDRVARWTAFREVGLATGVEAWGEATEQRWQQAATASLLLLGERGRRIVAGGLMPGRCTDLLLDAVAGLDGVRRRTVRALRGGRVARRGRARLVPRDLHDASAAVAIMRSDWRGDALRILVDYRDTVPHLEIAAGDRLLLDGPWRWNVTLGGEPLEAEGPWTAECWESDGKASMLEIAAPLPHGRRFERQVVMLPQDRVVLLADAITARGGSPHTALGHGPSAANGRGGDSSRPLRYAASIQPAFGLEADQADETREVLFFDARMRMMALPLALPEWQSGGGGTCDVTSAGLRLTLETAGARLYAPLWLDCEPERIGRPLTWRQLTVADTRLILPAWQAAGFRIQCGLEQWLVYRSLDAARNRSLLGCNVSCDFLIGRVKARGAIKRMLEIQ
ncbi:MAG: hypothetical protein FJ284_10145 [Planctomycetes bacterium]|nr:hypothetical protein [Planctomycetota bacterium]